MILSRYQAEAVYSAMCAQQSRDGFVEVTFDKGDAGQVVVSEWSLGVDVVSGYCRPAQQEHYGDRAAFAAAYGLNSDEPQSAVAAAAGGLTQTAIER